MLCYEAWYGSKDGCSDDGTVGKGNSSLHEGDWKTLEGTVKWIKDKSAKQLAAAADAKPWFAYQGMNIVHPSCARRESNPHSPEPRAPRLLTRR